jgi:hypothetical protein
VNALLWAFGLDRRGIADILHHAELLSGLPVRTDTEVPADGVDLNGRIMTGGPTRHAGVDIPRHKRVAELMNVNVGHWGPCLVTPKMKLNQADLSANPPFRQCLIRFASSGLRSGERLLMIHRITGNPLVQNDLEKKDRASAKLKQF